MEHNSHTKKIIKKYEKIAKAMPSFFGQSKVVGVEMAHKTINFIEMSEGKKDGKRVFNMSIIEIMRDRDMAKHHLNKMKNQIINLEKMATYLTKYINDSKSL